MVDTNWIFIGVFPSKLDLPERLDDIWVITNNHKVELTTGGEILRDIMGFESDRKYIYWQPAHIPPIG